jgi:aspartyl-tRNA(Asn)/glutamyl-tRNA(Gln) amidotransferase subunit B
MTNLNKETIDKYEVTIGIECHVQLNTKTKLFSGANNDARGQEPNSVTSPICFGMPGTLPVLNSQAIDLAIRAGIALQSTIAPLSRFERKHYFYPDLPKGYQITQLAQPTIGPGEVQITLPDGQAKTVRIHHAHLEEDAGKLTHPANSDYSLVDLNRAGTPLIEIVSEADMHSPLEAKLYAQELYLLMTYAGVTLGDLYHGNMRFDVNLTVAKFGEKLGTRTETKNLNSFRSIEKAAEFEVRRQIEELESGRKIVQETRGWDDDKQVTFSQRSKEDAHDYRYFPDNDIPPVTITSEQIDKIKSAMPKLPTQYRHEWAEIGLESSIMNALLTRKHFAELVSEVFVESGANNAKRVANWCASGVDNSGNSEPDLRKDPATPDRVETPRRDVSTSSEFIVLAEMAEAGEINSSRAKELFNILLTQNVSARAEAESRNMLQTNDTNELEKIVDEILADPASAKSITDIKSGNDKAIGYLVGQIMKKSQGKANPAIAQEIIRRKIGDAQS